MKSGVSFASTKIIDGHLAVLQGVLLYYRKAKGVTANRKGKQMLRRFYPDEYVDSTYEIDFKGLYRKGYRGVIFDIDNTLVPHGAPADERAKALFRSLKQLGLAAVLLSNNKEPRVRLFNEAVKVRYIHKAGKPSPRNYRKAMEMMGTDTTDTLFVGDQLFTDVWGAKRAGIKTYLVKPIHPKEEIQIVLKRLLERVVLFFYKRQLENERQLKNKALPEGKK